MNDTENKLRTNSYNYKSIKFSSGSVEGGNASKHLCSQAVLYRTNDCFFPEQLVPMSFKASSISHQETEALGGSGADRMSSILVPVGPI
jgi:hypothetical protein